MVHAPLRRVAKSATVASPKGLRKVFGPRVLLISNRFSDVFDGDPHGELCREPGGRKLDRAAGKVFILPKKAGSSRPTPKESFTARWMKLDQRLRPP